MKKFINESTTPLAGYNHILVGDLSGIQEFIFNTQSEGAAKTLKARSYYIQAVSEIALELVKSSFGEENCLLFYNGGGNFYVFIQNYDEENLKLLKKEVQIALADEELYLSLSVTPIMPNFKLTWSEVHAAANVDKLLKYTQYWNAFDLPIRADTDEKEREKWKEFIRPFVNQKETTGFILMQAPGTYRVSKNGLGWAQWQLQRSSTDTRFVNSIVNKLPIWTDLLILEHSDLVEDANSRNRLRAEKDPGKYSYKPIEKDDIIEFEVLGLFAQKRSGTDKIAVLKLDADNLGQKFRSLEKTDEAKYLSDLFVAFFDREMLNLWNQKFEYFDANGNLQLDRFASNIYPVFSGGDDCMFIGGWDAIFEFAKIVHEKFFADITSTDISLTLSGSLTLFDSKYPVVRLAQIAEEALKQAKASGRNRITVFSESLTWNEFEAAHKIAKQLEALIKQQENPEPRGILDRIKQSHRGYAKIQERAINGVVSNPAVWRLFYFIRKGKNLDKIEPIIQQYERALLNAVLQKQTTNPSTFPVAARWAEFLTR